MFALLSKYSVLCKWCCILISVNDVFEAIDFWYLLASVYSVYSSKYILCAHIK